jgi:hypothetical protein
MKTHVLYKLLAALLLVAALPNAQAAGRKIHLNIEDAMKRLDLAELLAEKSIAFYWADQIPSRPIEKEISTDTYSRGANATLKSDLRACTNAFENIAETLIEDAEKFGANAIIGIRSYHDDLPDFSSETEYRCDVGAFRASVGFRVRFVRLAP